VLDFWIMYFSNRPAHNCVSGVDGTSRFSREKFPCMPGVFDRAEPDECSRFRIYQYCLPHIGTASGALISDHFHGSIPCLHVPLPTLHVQPCDYPRMTRGQVGSLRLTCTTLAFAISRRFIPAHSNLVQSVESGTGLSLGPLKPRTLRNFDQLTIRPLAKTFAHSDSNAIDMAVIPAEKGR
jgi:hypothetical protein